jgi:type IV secretory pathway VirB4 component
MATQSQATQEFIPIQDIKEGVVLLKDGSLRAVIMASSLNFALKSEEEKNSIIFQFQNLLNSLDFSLQIFIQSRRLDIRPYLALIEGQYKEQVNDLMKIQIQEYIGFIKSFTESTNIMTKNFFIVVPYSPALLQGKSMGEISRMGFGGRKENPKEKAQSVATAFEENRTQLEQRVAIIEQGLVRCGVRTVALGTEEVIELFYKIFNPEETEKPIKMN